MPWVRLDDKIDEHPKIASVGPLGLALFVSGLAYCNRNLTDGFIPRGKAHGLLSTEWVDEEGRVWTASRTSGVVGEDVDGEYVAGLLVRHGLWEDADGGYRVHDFKAYQPSREQVIAEREATRGRVLAFRSRHSNGNGNATCNAASNGSCNAPVTPAPVPVPVPVPVPNPSVPYPTDTVSPETGDASPPPTRRPRKSGSGKQAVKVPGALNGLEWGTPLALYARWNERAPTECPAALLMDPKREARARERLAQFPDLEWWDQTFAEVEASPLLRGHVPSADHPNFRCDIDWLLAGAKSGGVLNCLKTWEGRYRASK